MSDAEDKDMARVEERLRNALKRLDLTSQFLIQSIFGIFGCFRSSPQRFAENERVSPETINTLQADALRALMGYGSKAPSSLAPSDITEDEAALNDLTQKEIIN